MPANPDRSDLWHRIEQLFYAVLDQLADRREAFLSRASGSDLELRREVESLLTAHVAGDELLEVPAIAHIGLVDFSANPPVPWTSGTIFGHYRITEPLGAGGM